MCSASVGFGRQEKEKMEQQKGASHQIRIRNPNLNTEHRIKEEISTKETNLILSSVSALLEFAGSI